MKSVCIVTNEVYPIDRGGIARLAYNFAVNNASSPTPVEMHFLLPAKLREKAAALETEFRGLVTIHYCPTTLNHLNLLGRSIDAAGSADSLDSHMIESLRYYAGLLEARQLRGADFDIVEFPDYGGWSHASIAAKRAGVAFEQTQFALRLHSTQGLIFDHEPFHHEPSDWIAGICDLERQSLRDADVVIAHLTSIARLNAERFFFAPQWAEKVRIEFPPIVLADPELQASDMHRNLGAAAPPPQNFLFSARLQPFKRPEIFVRAAVRFLDANFHADSLFLISSYGWDNDYIDWLKRLVPRRWHDRVRFLEGLSPLERAELMHDCILVIPSEFESLCLLAYEGRLLGLKLILNHKCLAFGAEPELWEEQKDCLFFDGDFISLADTMRRALDWTPDFNAFPESPPPYWEAPEVDIVGAKGAQQVKLAYILYGYSDLDELGMRIEELQRSFRLDRLYVLAPREAFDAAGVPVAAWQARGVTVQATSWLEPTASEIEAMVVGIDADAIAFLPADIRVESRFLSLAVRTLSAHPQVAIFTCHLALKGENLQRHFVLNYGDAPTVALITDRIAHRASVFRRDKLLETHFRESAGERWHEDLCTRLVNDGHEVVVAPAALATQTVIQRYSRIKSSCFFGTLRDEAGRRIRANYRQASAGIGWRDSIEPVDHAKWVARQEQATSKLFASSRKKVDGIHFDQVVLKHVSNDEGKNYSDLEIVVHGLHFGRTSIPWLGFKLGQFNGVAQIEFRDVLNAQQFFRAWPPATTDKWGAVAVWSASLNPHPQGIFFEPGDDHDLHRLALLLEYLVPAIGLLPLAPKDIAHWKRNACDLLRKLAGRPPAGTIALRGGSDAGGRRTSSS